MAVIYKWHESNKIKDEHLPLEVKQVYGWIITTDKRLVLVSKDNETWQFPGGKPNEKESLSETLTREVFEETSLDVSNMEKRFFGYNEVVFENKPSILQVRYLILCHKSSKELNLDVSKEDINEDAIKYVNTYSLEGSIKLITWLKDSGELKSFLKSYNS